MGLFSFLKTSEKALDAGTKVIDGAVSGIDKLFFTAEEKSEASLKAVDLWIETQKAIRDEGSARSITRRILAVMIIGFTLVVGLGACIIFPFNAAWAAYLVALLKEFGFMTGAVVVFYFGYYGFKAIVGAKK